MAKANNLDLEIVEVPQDGPMPEAVLKLNPLGKVPVFEGADGYTLTECIAIAIYSTLSHPYILDDILRISRRVSLT